MIKIVSSVSNIKPPEIKEISKNKFSKNEISKNKFSKNEISKNYKEASTDTQIIIPIHITKKSEINKKPAQSPDIL